ncbi:hypothetical protein [Mechercharimyces sp. CAU 1602]|uniref:hypothetical protein n=1 Tax=Mechercharimyces sp. CAU 1602 TaxID=2973933 RepID=UPI002162303A|nr:hypothetical protein [Mechercharimyces sp. CAU 1602]MCS1352317.1 hypothetical protein [Mechercharimyces sp. CAU 1602]
MLKRIGKGFLLVLLVIGLVTACSSEQEANQRYKSDDGYHGLSNANPNLRVGDWNTATVGSDQKKMVETAKMVNGVKEAKARITGPDAEVNVVPVAQLNKQEMARLQTEVEKKVQIAMPRYRVDVKVKKKPTSWLERLLGGTAE